MFMLGRHSQAARGFFLEIEFDDNGGFVTHNPTVVSGLDRDDLRRCKLQHASISILNMDLSAGKEADMRVHAEIRTDDRLHVC